MRPNTRLVWSTSACSASLEEMLAAQAVARPAPWRALIAFATSSQGASLRDEMVTLAPCSARRCAIARPMPLDEPVTMATLPVRSNSDDMKCFLQPLVRRKREILRSKVSLNHLEISTSVAQETRAARTQQWTVDQLFARLARSRKARVAGRS